MGNFCLGRDYRQDAGAHVNDVIETHLDTLRAKESMKIKMLLLGAGESGKSTLFKQMKINFVKDYAKNGVIEERENIIRAFYISFRSLVNAIRDSKGTLGNPDMDEMMDHLYPPGEKKVNKPKFTPKIVQFVHDVWNSSYGQEIWENRSKFQMTDSLGYFCDNIDRLGDPRYAATEEDFLRCRVPTSGIVEQTFSYRDVKMVVVDVGGQRSERKKWIQCFDQVDSVLFVAAISEFDQKLFEDTKVDRLSESIELFHSTLRFRVFQESPFMLFLNKQDLFLEKLEKIKNADESLDLYFPELGLGKDYLYAEDKILEHLINKFKGGALNPERIHEHVTTALDKDKFKVVFETTSKIILTGALTTHFDN